LSAAEQRTLAPEVVWAGVPGAKREGEDDPSQDAIVVARDGGSLIAAVADGAGSQFASGLGARFAAHGAVESLKEELEGTQSKSSIERALFRAIRGARLCLLTAAAVSDDGADGEGLEVENLATTLSVCVLTPEWVGIGSIGDGIHVLRDFDGVLSLAAMAPDTEIANQTDFLTGGNALDKLEFEVREAASVESILLSTDGLDTQLLGRRDDERWPLATVNSLIDAPVLDAWGTAEFERLLASDLIRAQTQDDCSLVLIRRPREVDRAEIVDGLELSAIGTLPTGRRAWAVGGCADLFAIEPPAAVPPQASIAKRGAQVWERGRRYPPVSWPVRRIDGGLTLVPRVLPEARSVGSILGKRGRSRRKEEVTAGIRDCVEALHTAGVAHGELGEECFVLQPDETVTLFDPGPGMFEGSDVAACVQRDLEFLAGLDGEPPAGEPVGSAAEPVPVEERKGRRRGIFGRRE
jgi:hypothetical protein